jgi:hypothetical protein
MELGALFDIYCGLLEPRGEINDGAGQIYLAVSKTGRRESHERVGRANGSGTVLELMPWGRAVFLRPLSANTIMSSMTF